MRTAQWRLENPEKARLSKHLYYLNNRSRIIARSKDWALRNPEKVKLLKKKSAAVNRINRTLSREKWAVNNPLKHRLSKQNWKVRNPETVLHHTAKAALKKQFMVVAIPDVFVKHKAALLALGRKIKQLKRAK